MPFLNIWIHLVWSTKNREPLLDSPELRHTVFQHIKENGESKKIHIDSVSGFTDHAHCLVSMRFDQTTSKLMQLIKGESSYWINKNNLCKSKYQWQEEYFVESVSESGLANLRRYIANQEEHHSKKTFQEEYDEIIRKWSKENLG